MASMQEHTSALPTARFENLVVTETADEMLIYDPQQHHIHHLNPTTAAVWRLCDGRLGISDIARIAGMRLEGRVDEATVRLALTKLDEAGLLAQPLASDLRLSRMNRRAFLQRSAIAGAVAVPAIVSTTAPASAFSPTTTDDNDDFAGFAVSASLVNDQTNCGASCLTDDDCKGGPCEFCTGNVCSDHREEEVEETFEQTEAERLAAEQAEADRLAAEQAEADRLAAEQAEADRLAAEQAEAERLAAEEAARLEAERLAAEEAARLEAERIAAEEAARLEAERLAAEEAARLEAERIAAEEAARLEAERLAAEEAARLEAERLAAEEAARLEAERLAAEEAARLEAERLAELERQRLAEEAARLEAERLAAQQQAATEATEEADE
jgi:hypothetical protein